MLEIILTLKNQNTNFDDIGWNCIHQSIFPVNKRDGFTNDWAKEQFRIKKSLSITVFDTIDENINFVKHFVENGGLKYFNVMLV